MYHKSPASINTTATDLWLVFQTRLVILFISVYFVLCMLVLTFILTFSQIEMTYYWVQTL